jgi:DNA transformation protein and related proteins
MAVSDEYLEYVLDQLEGLGPVFSRRMFGGVGLYCEDLFFGLIAEDILYFKVDETTKERYESAGASPFRPYGKGSYSMSYYEVPANVLEDKDEMRVWAQAALAVAASKEENKLNPFLPGRQFRKIRG